MISQIFLTTQDIEAASGLRKICEICEICVRPIPLRRE